MNGRHIGIFLFCCPKVNLKNLRAQNVRYLTRKVDIYKWGRSTKKEL